jgi:hypothetical protein
MARTFVTNPLTGRLIQVGGATFNQLILNAYDFTNGELIRRESAGPIPPREYYYNILTGRRILYGSRRYFELIRAHWDIEEDYYLIPPWIEVDVAQELMHGDRRRNLTQRQVHPVTYEQIMDRHRDTLANLNITLCRECFHPIKKEDNATTEYCEDCRPE